MTIVEITGNNINDYSKTLPQVFQSEINRIYIKAVAATDDNNEIQAAVIWEIKNAEVENKPTEVQILWFHAIGSAGGEAVLNEIINISDNNDIKRIYFELPEPGSEEKSALNKAGFTLSTAKSSVVSVTTNDISKVKLLKRSPEKYIKPLSEISTRQFKSGIMTHIFHGRYGLLDDLPFLPITRFDPEISCCCMMDEKINGFLLVHEIKPEHFRVELFAAIQPDAETHLLNLMRFSANALISQKSSDVKVLLTEHNKATVDLIRKIFPDIARYDVVKGEILI
ncbi:MAG: hypothetical protein K6F00_00730 [Lachnospiraceae bacterium]|nr:hypothetical protein [Lachnospiraceae bacterium]